MEIVVGITGATGSVYAVRLLEALKEKGVYTHLIMSHWAKENTVVEAKYSLDYLEGLAAEVHDNKNLGARTSSGSYVTDGMVVVPCSMKTLSSIANGYCENLISRSADVTIKEGRKLVICPRETPLSPIHLRNMLCLAEAGVKIVPPMPAFYNNPSSIDDIVNHHVMKLLDQFGINNANGKRWDG
ncbi:MAG: UbiX family flavin prenyltransferase [Peptococcaceae bacterium]|nr:UbiX family flavin prenyltransferase [Candidatus Syntrophopropionicum ammoniitolerans]